MVDEQKSVILPLPGKASPEVVKRYEKLGCAIYRTDKNGNILVYSNGNEYKVVTQKEGGES